MNTTKSNLRTDAHAEGKLTGLPGRLKGGSDRSRALLANARRLASYGEVNKRVKLARTFQPQPEIAIANSAGFRVFEPYHFSEIAEINEVAIDVVSRLKPEELDTKKAQLKVNLLDMQSLTLDSPQMLLALRSDILESISSYLGVVPVLWDVDVWYSIHSGKTPANSQLYHCDNNDVTQVKVFIYASDVDCNSGPLTVIGADSSKVLRDKLAYTYEGKRQRVSDEQVSEVLGDKDQHPIVGPKGSSAFVDTSRCFHFGSRVEEGATSRILTLLQFFTPTAFAFKRDFQQQAPLRHLDDPSLTELQRLVLGI